MQIRVTHAGSSYLDSHFTRFRSVKIHVGKLSRSTCLSKNYSFQISSSYERSQMRLGQGVLKITANNVNLLFVRLTFCTIEVWLSIWASSWPSFEGKRLPILRITNCEWLKL